MEEQIGATFILTVIFGFIFAIIYINVRRKERMAMLERGVDASFFMTKQSNTSAALKFGMLFIGVAIGLISGSILEVATRIDETVAYFSMIFLFGGSALVINYFIEKKENDKLQK